MSIGTFLNNKIFILMATLSLQSVALSCKTGKTVLAGKYESKNDNWIYRLLNLNAIKNKIEIRDDSTYVYETCANKITGYWKVSNDSLFLYCIENKYQVDSLNVVGFNGKTKLSCGEGPDILLMSDGRLYEDMKLKGVKKVIHLVYEKID